MCWQVWLLVRRGVTNRWHQRWGGGYAVQRMVPSARLYSANLSYQCVPAGYGEYCFPTRRGRRAERRPGHGSHFCQHLLPPNRLRQYYFVPGVTRQDVRWERRVSFRLLVAGESIRNRIPHRDRRSPGRHTGRGVGPKPCHRANLVRRGPGERCPENNRRFSTFSQESPRRCWVSWSRSLENSFSCVSSFRRASSHWSLETTV